MKNDQEFWNRVNEVLDQRKDPFDDLAIRAYLDEHPRNLERLAELAAGLALLEVGVLEDQDKGECVDPVEPRPSLGRSPLFARLLPVAAALLLALFFALWPRADKHESTTHPSFTGRILYYAITVTTTGPLASSTRVQGPDPWEEFHSEKASPSTGGSPVADAGSVYQHVIQQRRYSP
jgi:hypothetical protein